MLKLLIVEKDKDGNITLTPEKLEQMLMDAYKTGKDENENKKHFMDYPLDNLGNIKWTSNGATSSRNNDKPNYTTACSNSYTTTANITDVY